MATSPHALAARRGGGTNPTAGFEKVELVDGNFRVQSPYNVPESQRFRYRNGVRTFWVYKDDMPFNTATHTNPRTEVKISDHDYSSGVWQFEGYGYVPSGTSGVSVMQIHNQEDAEHSTVLMLHVYDGVLRFYSGAAVEPDIYDRWFRLNVVHDVGASTARRGSAPASSPATPTTSSSGCTCSTTTSTPPLESGTFPSVKDTREIARNTGESISLVSTLGISHWGEKSRGNAVFS
ncbi:hypothetical protein HU200_012328 [Digitaria exilis]|uniref:Alginate lyase 2 domain-containing protein n=1 Tax=Digitaria exilis TaxID=1010633 RepID=A0A835KLY1_9POAL|nr:hypothetical protein HU200_012328 [Digitaria exilis]